MKPDPAAFNYFGDFVEVEASVYLDARGSDEDGGGVPEIRARLREFEANGQIVYYAGAVRISKELTTVVSFFLQRKAK